MRNSKDIGKDIKAFNITNNEGCADSYNPYQDEYDLAIEAEVMAQFGNEWTRETTLARRSAWNAFVRSLGPATVSSATINNQEISQGWKMADLKAAIINHGL